MKLIRNAHAGMAQAKVLSMASKQLSGKKIKFVAYFHYYSWELEHQLG